MSVIRRSFSEDDKYGKVKSPFLTAINIFKFDSNTRCSLVTYTFGKLISGVILLLSMSIDMSTIVKTTMIKYINSE